MHVWHVHMKMCVWDDRCGGKGTYDLSDTGCSVKMCQKILLLDEGVDGGFMFGCFGVDRPVSCPVHLVLASGLRR